MIGRSLFVEVKNQASLSKFESLLAQEENKIAGELDVYSVNRCVRSNCLDLNVKEVNLVPLIEKSPNINIDTYLSVRNLGLKDFKYNGFIEVEILLDLPI